MPRPYLSLGIVELEALFEQRRHDLGTLQLLAEELGNRQTNRAGRLLSQVEAELSNHASEEEPQAELFEASADEDSPQDESDQVPTGDAGRPAFELEPTDAAQPPDDRKKPARLSLMRAPGTPGLPDAWPRKLLQDVRLELPENASLPETYIAALGKLIAEIRRTGSGQKRYELEGVIRTEGAGEITFYVCQFPDDGDLFEEARVEVQVGGRRVDGSIASIAGGRLVLALKEDLGPTMERVILLVDATVLLEALKAKIEEASKKEISLNRSLADAVVGKAKIPADPEGPAAPKPFRKLGAGQEKAYERALTRAVSYIWGPPGCGKTYTLGELARATLVRGERLLVCSNTNKAVDQILYHICSNLGREHEAMQAGHIVRIGRIADDKLAQEYSAFVAVDGIADRLAAELKERQIELERLLEALDARTQAARALLARYAELDRLESLVRAAEEETNRLAREGKEHKAKLEASQTRLAQLRAELLDRQSAFLKILKRSEAEIRGDITKVERELRELPDKIRAINEKYDQASNRFRAAQGDRDAQAASLAGTDRAAAEKEVADADEAREPYVAELREIATKIAQIRSEVMKRAKVLGATCTKAYLAARDIAQFDLVIIDEASMVLLPAIWFVAGLSQKRVAVCGDFRQIPPIVQTRQEAIFEVLGRDVFEAAGLADSRVKDDRMVMLDEQHRMDESICTLVSKPMYGGLLRTANARKTSIKPPPPFEGPLTIVDTSDLWPFESVNAFFSRFNLMHAVLARNLAWHLGEKGYVRAGSDLGICTPYAAQAKLIRKLVESDAGARVQVGTVHRFQGDERNAILIEIPESHGGGRQLGQFVQGVPPADVGARLINVAVSRAQNHLIVLANLTYLDRSLPSESLLREILYRMQRAGTTVAGSAVLQLRPIQQDLRGLFGKVRLDLDAENLGLFNQHTFDAAVMQDILAAEDSVVIFSGFITPARVAFLGDLLRERIGSGVKVRCVTRPPQRNGTMAPALTRDALDALEGVGCTVDCRQDIHEKVVLIDKSVVWYGSLNVLSHTHRTDESMTRLVNAGFAQALASCISKRPVSAEAALRTIAEAENPRCPDCESRTVFAVGRKGPFFYCERECGWTGDARHGVHTGRAGAGDTANRTGPPCPQCNAPTRLRQSRFGAFYSCSRYPECRGTAKVQ